MIYSNYYNAPAHMFWSCIRFLKFISTGRKNEFHSNFVNVFFFCFFLVVVELGHCGPGPVIKMITRNRRYSYCIFKILRDRRRRRLPYVYIYYIYVQRRRCIIIIIIIIIVCCSPLRTRRRFPSFFFFLFRNGDDFQSSISKATK
jgi:hypothetical protein